MGDDDNAAARAADTADVEPDATHTASVSRPAVGRIPGAAIGAGLAAGDWPAKGADLVEAVVGAVHEKVVRPLLFAIRGAVYGLLALSMLAVIGILLVITVVRFLDVYGPWPSVWGEYLGAGALLCGGGAACFYFAHNARTRAVKAGDRS